MKYNELELAFEAAQADYSSPTVIVNKQSGEVLIKCDGTGIYTLDEARWQQILVPYPD